MVVKSNLGILPEVKTEDQRKSRLLIACYSGNNPANGTHPGK